MPEAPRFCTFVVGDQLYGIEVGMVQEALRGQEVTRVPGAPLAVSGILNLRGQVLLSIDLRRRLGLPARAAEEPSMNLVLRTSEGLVSLVVDSVGDVIEVSPRDFERLPATLTAPAKELIVGAYKLEERLLLVLDAEKAIAFAAASSSAGEGARLLPGGSKCALW